MSDNEGLHQVAKAFVILGFSALSVWVGLETDWERGEGWAVLAVLILFFG